MEKDDLLNIQPKKNLKKPIIYGAAAFLVFIIGVIGYAIYANSTNKDNVVLPPQVNEKPSIKSDFKEIAVEDNVSDITQKINKNEILNNTEETQTKNPVNKPNINENQNKININQSKPKTKQSAENLAFEKPSTVEKPKPVKQQHKIITKGKYYIQVAALLKYKKPNKKFLALIKKEGFNYKFYHTFIVRNNQKIPITKLLIGPFANRKSARTNLVIIKKKLIQNAFIFRMK